MPTQPIPDAFLQRVLAPYRDNVRYVSEARWHHADPHILPVSHDPASWITVEGRGGIASSCYIDATGHFTAVELNIVYNQLLYLALASCAAAGLSQVVPWPGESFFQHQLPDVLIANYRARFTRPLNPHDFTARVKIRSAIAKPSHNMVWLETACEATCSSGGQASAEVTVALVRVR